MLTPFFTEWGGLTLAQMLSLNAWFQAWNFALYSKEAEEVTLLLYAETDLVNPVFTYRFDYLRNKSARIWHCRVAHALLRGAKYYAYSVGGPKSQVGFGFHCFDPDKILLDPYAKSVCFPPAFDRDMMIP